MAPGRDLPAGLVDMFEKHAKKGRLVYVAGKLQTRRWKKDEEDSERFSTEILLAPGRRFGVGPFFLLSGQSRGANLLAAPAWVGERSRGAAGE